MNVITEGWLWVENEDEWHDLCPEAEDIPEEFPVSVQILETTDGLLFSTLPPEIGTFLWNSPWELEFIPDFDVDEEEVDPDEPYYN